MKRIAIAIDGPAAAGKSTIAKIVAKKLGYVYIDTGAYRDVRLAMVDLQRKMAESVSVVMDGRDIGTYVLPNAEVKIFQVATVHERAKRRYLENLEKGIACNLEEIEQDLIRRDNIDSSRAFAPLRPAEDSILLDTSNMSINEVVNAVISIIEKKLGEME